MIPDEDQWSWGRGRAAVEKNLEVRFVQVWSQIGAVVIDGDEIARRRRLLSSDR